MKRKRQNLRVPRKGDRAVIIGWTGSGKTTLAEILVLKKPFVVVYDPKGLIAWKGFKRVTRLLEAKSLNPIAYPRIIYAPCHEEDGDQLTIDSFFEWIYYRKNTCVYIDEVYSVSSRGQIPHFYRAILTRGREMGICTISSTQRPMEIPQFVLSESEHYYVFRMRLPQDKDKVKKIIGLDNERIEALEKYQFFYADAEGSIVGPNILTFS